MVTQLIRITTIRPRHLLLNQLPRITLLTLPQTKILNHIQTRTPSLTSLINRILPSRIHSPSIRQPMPHNVSSRIHKRGLTNIRPSPLERSLNSLPLHRLSLTISSRLTNTRISMVTQSPPRMFRRRTQTIITPIRPRPNLFRPLMGNHITLLRLLMRQSLPLIRSPMKRQNGSRINLFHNRTILRNLFKVRHTRPSLRRQLQSSSVNNKPLSRNRINVIFPRHHHSIINQIIQTSSSSLFPNVNIQTKIPKQVVLLTNGTINTQGHQRTQLTKRTNNRRGLLQPRRSLNTITISRSNPFLHHLIVTNTLTNTTHPMIRLRSPNMRLGPINSLILKHGSQPNIKRLSVKRIIMPSQIIRTRQLMTITPLITKTIILISSSHKRPGLTRPHPRHSTTLPTPSSSNVKLTFVPRLNHLNLTLLTPTKTIPIHTIPHAR